MAIIALLYYYRALQMLKRENPVYMSVLIGIFGTFLWGLIHFGSAGRSRDLLYALSVCISLLLLYFGDRSVSVQIRERFFVYSSVNRNFWAICLLKFRLIMLALVGTAVLLFFYSAVELSFLSGIQQSMLFVFSLLLWVFMPARYSKYTAIAVHAVFSTLIYGQLDSIPAALVIPAIAAPTGLLCMVFLLRQTPAGILIRQTTPARLYGRRARVRTDTRSRTVISGKHLKRIGVNSVGIAAGIASVLLIHWYSSQIPHASFVSVILLNAGWLFIVLFSLEHENFSMPILAGMSVNGMCFHWVWVHLPALLMVTVSTTIAIIAWTGWAGLAAIFLSTLLTVTGICLHLRCGAISLPRFLLLMIVYSVFAVILWYSVPAGITVLFIAACREQKMARLYYKTRVFDNVVY